MAMAPTRGVAQQLQVHGHKQSHRSRQRLPIEWHRLLVPTEARSCQGPSHTA